MSSKVIAVDVDDVIENLLAAWLKYLNDRYGTNVRYDEVDDWDISKFYPNLSKEQVYEPLHIDEFWKTVEPKTDAMKYMKELFDEGYEIFLCTSTDYRNVRAKYEYIIKRYFPFIEWDHVIITYRKQMIKADYLIDDGVHNLVGGDFTKILMTAPHNRKYDAKSNGMIRVSNWEEIYNIIRGTNENN